MRTSNPCARGQVAQLKREEAVCLSVPYISLRPISCFSFVATDPRTVESEVGEPTPPGTTPFTREQLAWIDRIIVARQSATSHSLGAPASFLGVTPPVMGPTSGITATVTAAVAGLRKCTSCINFVAQILLAFVARREGRPPGCSTNRRVHSV